MAGRVTVLTPVDRTPVIELGNSTWRKQILPVGWLNYDDGTTKRRLNFTPEYLRDLVAAFKAKAFPGVPLQLGSTHNNDPENTAGQIIGLDSDDQGLYATVSATDRGTQLLRDNPNLGVSVRVVEDYERQDGKTAQPFKAALQHVLATWVPRVAGMAPWQAVQCADETEGRVIDLSALVFTDDGHAVTPTPAGADGGQQEPPTQKARATVPEQLTEEELAAARAALPVLLKLVQPTEGDAGGDTAGGAATTVTPPVVTPPAGTQEVSDEDLDDIADGVTEDGQIAASDDDQSAIELAQIEMQTRMDAMAIELAERKAERDAERWTNESQSLVRDYGIPPAIVALAEPLLKGDKHVVELAQGSTVDAGKVLRDVLHTVAKTYGRKIDLSELSGSAHEISAAQAAQTEDDEFLAAQHARYGR